MPKKITFENIDARLEEVKKAMKVTKDKRLYERYQCIYLLLLNFRTLIIDPNLGLSKL